MRQRLTFARFAPAFYWWATYTLRGLLWVLGRWVVRGRERAPRTGGIIIVSNHLHNADPPILAAGIARRRVRYMAKAELFNGVTGIIPKLYGAFPVKRFDADIGALLAAERLLRDGWALGMFPEGTRSRSGKLGRPHPGTALIALRSGAPVVPCAMTGTEQLRNPLCVLRRPRFTVTIGEPIMVERVRKPTEAQVSDLTERIFAAIRDMLPPQYLPTYTEADGNDEAAAGGDPPGY